MSIYSGYFRNAFLQQLAYRGNYWLRLTGGGLAVLIQYYLWLAVYGAAAGPLNGYTLRDALTYAIVAAACEELLQMELRSDQKVRDGSIALSLAKPADWELMVFAETAGWCVFRFAAVAVPTYLIALALGVVGPPASLLHGLSFLLSLALAFGLLFAFSYLTGLASFWTKAGWGFVDFQGILIAFFAGRFIPLALYPVWLQHIAAWLPFQGMYYLPLSIYLGKVEPGALAGALAGQAAWLVALVWLSRRLWWGAVRRLTVQGG